MEGYGPAYGTVTFVKSADGTLTRRNDRCASAEEAFDKANEIAVGFNDRIVGVYAWWRSGVDDANAGPNPARVIHFLGEMPSEPDPSIYVYTFEQERRDNERGTAELERHGFPPELVPIFLEEIIQQADFALRAIRLVQPALEDHRSVDVFQFIEVFLNHAAKISLILLPEPRGKSATRHESLSRGAFLRELLGADDSPILNRDLRNHLQHFDERLHCWAKETGYAPYVDKNIGQLDYFSAALGLEPSAPVLRHYDPSSHVFHFRDDKFAIQPIVDAVANIRQAAARQLDDSARKGRSQMTGGSVS